MTIRQMSRLYSGVYNFYKTTYNGGQITRETAQKKISTNWNAAKNNLNVEYSEAMANLKKSASEVKNFDIGGENSIEKVEKFLNDYNDAKKFFEDNSAVSKSVSRLAENFSDAKYFAKNYSEIGIEVAKDGAMKVDAEKFAEIAEKNPQKVTRILGSMANRAENKISVANLQKNLFSVRNEMYGVRGILQNMSQSGIGGVLNLFF